MNKNAFLTFILAFSLFAITAYFPRKLMAQSVADTDMDGLTDTSELQKFNTDPNRYDTDGDGVSDGQEIMQGTDPLNYNDSPLSKTAALSRKSLIDKSMPVAWYLARASGILAFILLTCVVTFGMGISTRAFFKFLRPPVALETHSFIAQSALMLVFLHFSSLFFDTYFKMKPNEALIPFQLHRDFSSALGFDFNIVVSLGIIAFYIMVVLVTTSRLRSKMPIKIWRTIHYSSFIAYFLFLAHGYLSGTDSKEPWMLAIYIVSTLLVGGMFTYRVISGIRAKVLISSRKETPKVITNPQVSKA